MVYVRTRCRGELADFSEMSASHLSDGGPQGEPLPGAKENLSPLHLAARAPDQMAKKGEQFVAHIVRPTLAYFGRRSSRERAIPLMLLRAHNACPCFKMCTQSLSLLVGCRCSYHNRHRRMHAYALDCKIFFSGGILICN